MKEPAVVEGGVNNARQTRPDGDEQAPSGLMRIGGPLQFPRLDPAQPITLSSEVSSAMKRPRSTAQRVNDLAVDNPGSAQKRRYVGDRVSHRLKPSGGRLPTG